MSTSSRIFLISILACSMAFLLAAPFVFAEHDININTAEKDALMTLSGIGEVKAQAIIDYRSTNGPFQNKEDITNVSGIGPATYNNIKDHITVQGGSSSLPSAPASPPGAPSPASQTSSASAVSNDFVVDAGGDRAVIVGADVPFSVRAYRSKELLPNVSFMWNFGDGSTAEGAAVVHRFEYPGRYSVVVTGGGDGAIGSDRFTATAELAQLVVRALQDGSVEIENLAGRDVDLSRWILRSSGQRFMLPDNSLVLAKQVMRISPNTLHFYAGSTTELDFPNGSLAFSAREYVPETASSTIGPAPASLPAPPPSLTYDADQRTGEAAPTQTSLSTEEVVAERAEEAEAQEPVAASSTVAAAATAATSFWKWWLGALAVSTLAGGAVFASRRFGRKEWNIIEGEG